MTPTLPSRVQVAIIPRDKFFLPQSQLKFPGASVIQIFVRQCQRKAKLCLGFEICMETQAVVKAEDSESPAWVLPALLMRPSY